MTKAEEILKSIYIHPLTKLEKGWVVEFAKQMCELQKEECAESAMITRQRTNIMFDWTYTVNKDSIKNCKNVCDE